MLLSLEALALSLRRMIWHRPVHWPTARNAHSYAPCCTCNQSTTSLESLKSCKIALCCSVEMMQRGCLGGFRFIAKMTRVQTTRVTDASFCPKSQMQTSSQIYWCANF